MGLGVWGVVGEEVEVGLDREGGLIESEECFVVEVEGDVGNGVDVVVLVF